MRCVAAEVPHVTAWRHGLVRSLFIPGGRKCKGTAGRAAGGRGEEEDRMLEAGRRETCQNSEVPVRKYRLQFSICHVQAASQDEGYLTIIVLSNKMDHILS